MGLFWAAIQVFRPSTTVSPVPINQLNENLNFTRKNSNTSGKLFKNGQFIQLTLNRMSLCTK